jgi:flagellar hook-associated protein 1 FlgK
MPDLLSVLANAANSMAAQRAATATASHNIANVNTPGYARQRAVLVATQPAEQLASALIGRGAELGTVTQVRDRFVEAQVPRVLAEASRSSAEAQALAAVHALDPERAGSLSEAVAGFYGTLRELTQNAGEPGVRTAALASARTLAAAFQRTSGDLAAARSGADARVRGFVDEVNAAARAVADANAAIQRARASGAEPNDLLDLRLGHLDRLAELTGGVPVAQADGAINVILPGGGAIVSGALAGQLSTEADAGNSGLLRLRLSAPDGSLPAPLAKDAVGGALGGVLAARDGGMRDALHAVDTLAADVAAAVNAVHVGGRGLDGTTGLALFRSNGTGPITARSIEVAIADPRSLAAASAGGALPGDGANALLLLATERQALSNGRDVQAELSAVTSAFGAESMRAAAWSEQDEGLKEQLLAMRESASGVSIDEELVEMQRAQRAFEAIAKVLQVADDMMKTLLQLR